MIKILDLALDLLGSFSCRGRSVINDKILILCDLLIPWERLEEKAAAVGLWAAFAVAAAVADGWTTAKNGVENSQRPENKGTGRQEGRPDHGAWLPDGKI